MKSYKNQNTLLDEAIARLEVEKAMKFDELKIQMHHTLTSMKPINILNGTLEDLKQFPEVKSNILQIITSLIGGYVSKKIVIGKSTSTVKKIMGYLFQYAVTHFISKKVQQP
ncbi:hypothetical protein [Flavobacterium sp. UMI-01]|uniref:hypothetical protein n=1 Tax=Flavobacterium sp. UMI-01 TaxID=1441053 RepID=UPI001C7DE4CB|nr:hypothetical protein [Flavobacterium sp. UMI-01]GIZ08168.1 hypothetical protein FUMI01_08950 [Flavobacterium sp. UMI-01]